jgi:hypothetical protein
VSKNTDAMKKEAVSERHSLSNLTKKIPKGFGDPMEHPLANMLLQISDV